MSTNKSGDTGVGSNSDTKSTRSIRGKVCLIELAKRKARGEKNVIEFNAKGQPIGPTSCEMQSYIGMLARQHVKVSCENWKAVPDKTKETIWELVTIAYDVDRKWKSGCLESANTKWRQWKSTLYKEYVVPNKGNLLKLKEPPPCNGILRDDWNQFLKHRLTKDFDKFSEQQSQRASQNKYRHRLSRRGYAGLAEDMKDELCGEDDVDRAIMWKKARVPKNGSIEDEKLKKTMEKIDDCIRLKHEGQLNTDMLAEDLLSYALEKPEHSGRVRAVGSYITPTMYFNRPKEKRKQVRAEDEKNFNDMQKLIKKYAELVANLQERVSQLESEKEKDKDKEENGSCSVKDPHVWMDEEIKKMQENEDVDDVFMYNKIDTLQAVAKSSELDSPPLPKKARQQVVKERLVKCFDILHSSLKVLCIHAEKHLTNGEGIFVPFNAGMFGKSFEVFVHIEDIVPFCELEPISGNCVVIYMRHVYKILENSGIADMFCFVDPFDVSYVPKLGHHPRTRALADRLQSVSPNQYVICPCNIGEHWILTIVDPHSETIYIFDPLGHRIRDNSWKTIVNSAISMFKTKLGKRGKKNPTWKVMKSPLQPDFKQCGFFILRFMKDIIEGAIKSGSVSLHSLDNRVYEKKEIDEVRVEWANLLLEHI